MLTQKRVSFSAVKVASKSLGACFGQLRKHLKISSKQQNSAICYFRGMVGGFTVQLNKIRSCIGF